MERISGVIELKKTIDQDECKNGKMKLEEEKEKGVGKLGSI